MIFSYLPTKRSRNLIAADICRCLAVTQKCTVHVNKQAALEVPGSHVAPTCLASLIVLYCLFIAYIVVWLKFIRSVFFLFNNNSKYKNVNNHTICMSTNKIPCKYHTKGFIVTYANAHDSFTSQPVMPRLFIVV